MHDAVAMPHNFPLPYQKILYKTLHHNKEILYIGTRRVLLLSVLKLMSCSWRYIVLCRYVHSHGNTTWMSHPLTNSRHMSGTVTSVVARPPSWTRGWRNKR